MFVVSRQAFYRTRSRCRQLRFTVARVTFWGWGELLPRHPQLDHHPLVPFVINKEMAMEEKATVFLKMRARDRLAPRAFGVQGRGPQDDVLAVERAVALTDRHCRLPRVVPHRCEAI